MMRAIPLFAAVTAFVIHLLANPHYGFFRDELYFIICGFHPAWGYVDQPPVVPLLAAATQLGGHSLILLRAVPALFAAAGVYVTCRLVVALGGGAFAQVFAAVVVLFSGVLASFGGKVGPDEVGLWTWPLIALLVVRIAKGADPRWWLAVGAAAGLSLESKYSALFFLSALLAALLLMPARRLLAGRWFAAGCGVAILIALPNFLWQWQNGLPMLELLKNGQNGKNVVAGPLLFLVQQVLITTPFLAPVWIVGLIWLLRSPQFRFLGFAYLILIAEMIVLHGKHYYPADVYPIVIAAGALPFEAWTRARRPARAALLAYALAAGLVFVPFSLPVLSEDAYVAYQAKVMAALHMPKEVLATERGREASALPGDWADMHGWPELAAAVQRVYDSLPPRDRARAVVLADNYGTAAAIEFFTPSVPVISTHNQYWLWGTHGNGGNLLVQVGGTCFARTHRYASRTVVTRFSSRWGIAYEQDLPIAICRATGDPLKQLWPEYKNYQ
jgi:4-amino-4-deoxy-L-arabinose transferase-like glycosyltransferase